jgi:hypothetical protein
MQAQVFVSTAGHLGICPLPARLAHAALSFSQRHRSQSRELDSTGRVQCGDQCWILSTLATERSVKPFSWAIFSCLGAAPLISPPRCWFAPQCTLLQSSDTICCKRRDDDACFPRVCHSDGDVSVSDSHVLFLSPGVITVPRQVLDEDLNSCASAENQIFYPCMEATGTSSHELTRAHTSSHEPTSC